MSNVLEVTYNLKSGHSSSSNGGDWSIGCSNFFLRLNGSSIEFDGETFIVTIEDDEVQECRIDGDLYVDDDATCCESSDSDYSNIHSKTARLLDLDVNPDDSMLELNGGNDGIECPSWDEEGDEDCDEHERFLTEQIAAKEVARLFEAAQARANEVEALRLAEEEAALAAEAARIAEIKRLEEQLRLADEAIEAEEEAQYKKKKAERAERIAARPDLMSPPPPPVTTAPMVAPAPFESPTPKAQAAASSPRTSRKKAPADAAPPLEAKDGAPTPKVTPQQRRARPATSANPTVEELQDLMAWVKEGLSPTESSTTASKKASTAVAVVAKLSPPAAVVVASDVPLTTRADLKGPPQLADVLVRFREVFHHVQFKSDTSLTIQRLSDSPSVTFYLKKSASSRAPNVLTVIPAEGVTKGLAKLITSLRTFSLGPVASPDGSLMVHKDGQEIITEVAQITSAMMSEHQARGVTGGKSPSDNLSTAGPALYEVSGQAGASKKTGGVRKPQPTSDTKDKGKGGKGKGGKGKGKGQSRGGGRKPVPKV